MYELAYHRPHTLADAVALLRSCDNPKLLAGGQSLLPTLKQRLASPSDLIDVSRLPELNGITVENGRIEIGAASVYADVADSPAVIRNAPCLAFLAGMVADPQVRNRGTVGGSLSNNDPSADFPAAALALDAIIHTTHRSLGAGEFFDGLFATVLADDEIVTRISFGIPLRGAYEKLRHPASRYAVCGAFVAQFRDHCRVAITGAGSNGVFRLREIESLLQGEWRVPSIDEIPVHEPLMSDLYCEEDYRAQLVRVVTRRAIAKTPEPALPQRNSIN
jgi:aerobic carbon-monoxide dehydrogenase medium subunit